MAGHGTAAHQRARRALLAQHDEGDPCCRCARPMYSWQELQADHLSVPLVLDAAALPDALAHRRCNAYAGWLVSRVRTGQSTPPKADPALEAVRQQVLAQLAELGQDVVMPEPTKPIVTRTSRAW